MESAILQERQRLVLEQRMKNEGKEKPKPMPSTITQKMEVQPTSGLGDLRHRVNAKPPQGSGDHHQVNSKE